MITSFFLPSSPATRNVTYPSPKLIPSALTMLHLVNLSSPSQGGCQDFLHTTGCPPTSLMTPCLDTGLVRGISFWGDSDLGSRPSIPPSSGQLIAVNCPRTLVRGLNSTKYCTDATYCCNSDFTYMFLSISVSSFCLKSMISSKAQLEGVFIKSQVKRDTDKPGKRRTRKVAESAKGSSLSTEVPQDLRGTLRMSATAG